MTKSVRPFLQVDLTRITYLTPRSRAHTSRRKDCQALLLRVRLRGREDVVYAPPLFTTLALGGLTLHTLRKNNEASTQQAVMFTATKTPNLRGANISNIFQSWWVEI